MFFTLKDTAGTNVPLPDSKLSASPEAPAGIGRWLPAAEAALTRRLRADRVTSLRKVGAAFFPLALYQMRWHPSALGRPCGRGCVASGFVSGPCFFCYSQVTVSILCQYSMSLLIINVVILGFCKITCRKCVFISTSPGNVNQQSDVRKHVDVFRMKLYRFFLKKGKC